jgi:hypothetical protein
MEQENWIYTNTHIWINVMLIFTSSLRFKFIIILYKNLKNYIKIFIIIKIIIKSVYGIQIGDKTHNQLHDITPTSFKTMKINVKTSPKPIFL